MPRKGDRLKKINNLAAEKGEEYEKNSIYFLNTLINILVFGGGFVLFIVL